MEDVDRIRQLYQETGSRRKVADIIGISRNTVTKYLNRIEDCQNGNAEEILPTTRNLQRTKSALSDDVVNKIHTYLEEIQKRPKKTATECTSDISDTQVQWHRDQLLNGKARSTKMETE
jgi:transposase